MITLIIIIIVLWFLLKPNSTKHNSNRDNSISSNKNFPEQNRKRTKLANVEDLEGKAKRGDREAQYNLGTLFYNGDGVAKNYKIAAEWYQQATYQGHAKAAYALGMMYLHGVGVNQDGKRAVELFYISSKNGFSEAKAALEQMKNEGREVDSIIEQYKHKAEQENNSYCNNRFSTVNKPGVKMNDNQSANNNQQAYQFFRKGWDYEQGNGVKADIALAMDYYHKAADLGLEIASYRLKMLNERGYSDLYKRRYGYQQSVRQKNPIKISTVNKSTVKMNDNQSANNNQQAYQFFRKGWDYEQGNGVKADIALAMDYYHKAADLGSEIASYRLKMLNERGYSDLYKRSISDQQRKASKVNNDSNTSKPEKKHKSNDDVAQRGVSVRERAQKSQQLFNRAKEQKRQGQYQAALITYKQAYEAYPDDPDVQSTMYAMAKVYLLIGDYEKSCALFQDGLTMKLAQTDERVARFYKKYLQDKFTGNLNESDSEFVWFKNLTADYSIFIGLTHYLLENNGAELLDQYRYDFINHIKSVAGKSAEPPSREYLVTCYEYGWTRVLAIASESSDRWVLNIDVGYVQKRKQEFLDILDTICDNSDNDRKRDYDDEYNGNFRPINRDYYDDDEYRHVRYGVSMGPDGNYYDEYGDYVPDDCAYEDD